MAIITLAFLAGGTSAYSYSDEDGDGVCEPGETITLVGDNPYIDEEGNVHEITLWFWDFDGDLIYDEMGPIVTHTFPDVGTYTVTLMMMNDVLVYIDITIEVKINDDTEPEFKVKKIKKILNWLENDNIPDEVKIKLIVKHMKKIFDEDIEADNIEELKVIIYDFINDLAIENKCNKKCK